MSDEGDMQKIRFRLWWFHKMKDLKMKGLREDRRLSDQPTHFDENSGSLSGSPAMACHCPLPAKTDLKSRSAESESSLSPLNDKALEISLAASSRRRALPLYTSPSRAASTLSPRLNPKRTVSFPRSRSDLSEKVMPRSAIVKVRNFVSLGCSPSSHFAASLRKAKESIQAFAVGRKPDEYDKQNYTKRVKDDKKLTDLRCITGASEGRREGTMIGKMIKEKGRESASKNPSELLCSLSGVDAQTKDRLAIDLGQLNESENDYFVKSKTQEPLKHSGVELLDSSSCGCEVSSVSGDAVADSNSDPCSFTSDEFFHSEKDLGSNSSYSSEEFLDRSRVLSFFNGISTVDTPASPSICDDRALVARKDEDDETEKEIVLKSASFKRANIASFMKYSDEKPIRKDPFPAEVYANDQDDNLSHLSSDHSEDYKKVMTLHSYMDTDAVDLEANSKSWRHHLVPDISLHTKSTAHQTSTKEARRKASSLAKRAAPSPVRSRSPQSAQAMPTVKSNKCTTKDKISTLQHLHLIQAAAQKMEANLRGKVQGTVGDSFAMVKRSRDPYLDFRDSMIDMILEKQILKSSELEELLQCFLSLNAHEHHETIVRAFSEVWRWLFEHSAATPSLSHSQ